VNDLIYKLALTQVPFIGPVLAKNAIAYCGGADKVFKQKRSQLLKIPGFGSKIAQSVLDFKDFSKLEDLCVDLEKHKIQTHFFLDSNYPFRLKNIVDCPIMIFTKGSGDLNPEKAVAVVGTRNMSEYGRSFIDQFISDLAYQRVAVFSGMAYGVDIMAHKAALKHGLPTFGVMAHGLDIHYPALHLGIAKDMLYSNGGLISEYVNGTKPDREHFPERNRIIAGLCDVVVVVESAQKGGSLITASLANQYDREVMAVPGSISSETSKGCNQLIKNNQAHLLESATDLVKLMNWEDDKPRAVQQQLFVELNNRERDVLDIITGNGTIELQMLVVECKKSSTELAAILLELELKNCIYSLPGMRYKSR
jgi:DNA processing protein